DAIRVADLEDARVRYLGRKSPLKLALREIRERETGMLLNGIRQRLEAALDAREAELAAPRALEGLDVTLPAALYGHARPRGHLHLITQIRREVEDVFLG